MRTRIGGACLHDASPRAEFSAKGPPVPSPLVRFDPARCPCATALPLASSARLPRYDKRPDDMTPDEFRETVAFVYGPTFDFLCRTLLRREGAYIRRLLQLPPKSPYGSFPTTALGAPPSGPGGCAAR